MYSFLLCNSNFVFKTRRFSDIRLQKCRDLENRVRGPPMSLEILPFDRAHMTSYWRSIVTMALSRAISEIFNVEKCRTLKSGSEVTQGHWKWYDSIDCVSFPIRVFLVTLSLKRTVFEIFDFQNAVTLKTGLGVRHHHHHHHHHILFAKN